MNEVFADIQQAIDSGRKLAAVLIDPDKFYIRTAPELIRNIHNSPNLPITHILIGGSSVPEGKTEKCLAKLKNLTELPLILFPGDYSQISSLADAILILSLLSGANSEYLIGIHRRAARRLAASGLECIPTGYIHIDGGNQSAISHITGEKPIPASDIDRVVQTAMAAQFLGKKLIYLEAGSGALKPVSPDIIAEVCNAVNLVVIVGGGLRNIEQINAAYQSGAGMIVIGTALENNFNFLNTLS